MVGAKGGRGKRASRRSRSGNGFRSNGFPRKLSDLQVLTSDDGVVVFQPKRDRVHDLNQTAFLVLELADGTNSPQAIAARLRDVYGLRAAPEKDVATVLEQLQREKLIHTPRDSQERRNRRQTRRQVK